ncbi:MAG TPA: hypothetical protein DHV48_11250 [Prolixibacteraceae bacterium]|nr:hypothetical protein [Prolixibacteraceae bacterium]
MFRQNKLSILILLHLLLLWYPQMIKSVHVHHEEDSCCHHNHGVSFDIPEEVCPVCDFEFVSFVQPASTQFSAYLPIVQALIIPENTDVYIQPHFRLSLRGPPVS